MPRTDELAMSLEATVIGRTALPGDERPWALAVARLPDIASVVLRGEPRTGPGRSESPAVTAAWARTAQAIARERALWCESADDDGRLVVLVLPFGLVPNAHHRLPRGALCLACAPPEFCPDPLPPLGTDAVFRAALAAVVQGKDRPGAPVVVLDAHGKAALRLGGRGTAPDAWVPVSNWAGVPLPDGRVVGVCTDSAAVCAGLPENDMDLELPGMQAGFGAMEGMVRGPDGRLLQKLRDAEEGEGCGAMVCDQCEARGGGCRAGLPAVVVAVPGITVSARRPVYRVAEPVD